MALPDGRYYIEWYERGKRRRQYGGSTVTEILEARQRKLHELEGQKLGMPGYEPSSDSAKKQSLSGLVEQYLEQIEALKKPNTYRKYKSVLNRFAAFFTGRLFSSLSNEDVNEYMVHLKKVC